MRFFRSPSLLLFTLGCAATIPEIEHRQAIEAQSSRYEHELERARDARRRVEDEVARAEERSARERAQAEERIRRLEDALGDKQRLLDASGGDRAKLRRGLDKAAVQQKLDKRLGAAKSSLELADHPSGVSIRIPANQFFLSGSSRLIGSGAVLLERLVAMLRELPATHVEIAVHTDLVRPEVLGAATSSSTKTLDDTWALGQRQGLTLIRAAVGLGLDPSRVSVASFGQYRPVAPSDTVDDRRKNRRVELILEAL